MCELLGMSANVPTDICFSFTGLSQRGGKTGPHKDGWGIAFYEGKGCRTFKDTLPGSDSPIARLVREYPIKSNTVIAHVRKASRGRVALENTHPFTRELWKSNWTFAHNGHLRGIDYWDTGHFRPIGSTDSEQAFCWLLHQISSHYLTLPRATLRMEMFYYISALADELRKKGVFNMLLSDGRHLMAYCSTDLYWITRRAPFGKARLLDQEMEVDFREHASPADVVTVVATHPLTDNEDWQRIEPGQWRLFRLGERKA